MDVAAFTEPFRHWLVDGMDVGETPALPAPDWSGWTRYDNDCEKGKRTARPPLPAHWSNLLGRLTTPAMVRWLSELTGVGLQADPDWHGAGLHVTDPGGWLNAHLDYALHPRLKLERRVNLVLFLNECWPEDWGGAFEMYDPAARGVVKRVYPSFRRALIWEAGDLAYHGTQETTANAAPRITAAAYYLAQPRPGCTRQRALFVPRRG